MPVAPGAEMVAARVLPEAARGPAVEPHTAVAGGVEVRTAAVVPELVAVPAAVATDTQARAELRVPVGCKQVQALAERTPWSLLLVRRLAGPVA